MRTKVAFTAIICLSISSHGIARTPISVRVLSQQQREKCKYLDFISSRISLGPNKSGRALKGALKKVAAIGGNGLFIIETNQNLFDGAAVNGEAMICDFSKLTPSVPPETKVNDQP